MSPGSNPESKKICTAEVMPCIWVIVPIPKSAARVPKMANITASGFHFGPSPFSM